MLAAGALVEAADDFAVTVDLAVAVVDGFFAATGAFVVVVAGLVTLALVVVVDRSTFRGALVVLSSFLRLSDVV